MSDTNLFMFKKVLAYSSVSVMDLVTDFCILVLPMPMLLNLRMKVAHKIALTSVFAAGAM